jgi:hypothetical protein
MSISRRHLIKAALAAAGGAVAAYAGYLGPVRALYGWLRAPGLLDAPTGPLGEDTVRTLLAATETFIGYPVEKDHYADFFRWHSETLRGYHTLYERFAATVTRAARQSRGCAFAECEDAARRRILEAVLRVRSRGLLGKLRARIFEHDVERDWEQFDSFIVRPVLELFARTDVWRLAGYDGWPGTPRGLERYRRA